MTDYRLFPSTSGPSTSINSGTSFVFGLGFTVTSSGYEWLGVYWWIAGDSLQNTAAQTIGLWTETGASTGTFISGSNYTGSAMTGGQWNLISAGTPVALTSGTSYRAVITATPGAGNHPFADTSNYYTSANPGGNGIINGPLTGYSDGGSGSANKDPNGTGQCTNFSGGTSVSTQYPVSTSHSNYWMDVLIGPASAPPSVNSGALMVFP